MNILYSVETLSNDSLNFVPSDEKTINVVLFCDVNEPSEFDFVIFWISHMNYYFTKQNPEYHINFDYETNLNMNTNIYNLSKTPTIRTINQYFYIDFTEIDVKNYTYDAIMNIIEKNIDTIIKKRNNTNE
jgi:hypothetical protein